MGSLSIVAKMAAGAACLRLNGFGPIPNPCRFPKGGLRHADDR